VFTRVDGHNFSGGKILQLKGVSLGRPDLEYHILLNSICFSKLQRLLINNICSLPSEYSYENGCDYQADVCWLISNTIKQTSVGKSQTLSSRRREFGLNFCLMAKLTLILTLRPSRCLTWP